MRKHISLAAVMTTLAMAGCQMTPVQKGGLIGGATGAAIGGVWAANAGALTALEGAAVGAAVGTAGGSLGADALEKRKQPMPAEQPAVDATRHEAEIEGLRQEAETKGQRVKELEEQLDELREQDHRQPKPDEVSLAPAPAPVLTAVAAPSPAPAAMAVSDEELRDLQQAVGSQVEVSRAEKGIALTFVSEVLFSPGKASLSRTGAGTLARVAGVLRERYPNNEMSLEGHTDNTPIQRSGYKSNWELSSERAAAVLHYLINEESFRPDLLSMTGYADTRPVAPNDTALGRRLNRRAVILILPDIRYEKEQLSR